MPASWWLRWRARFSLETRLVFRPVPATREWRDAPDAAIEEVRYPSSDGTPLVSWWLPAPASDRAILMCHGNGGNVSFRGPMLLRLRDRYQASVLIFDYPGYGKSGGRPSETGCHAAARASWDWLRQRGHAAGKILLFGESLGGGVAVPLAADVQPWALVLIKTFTSVVDVARWRHPWYPAHWLMWNRFESAARIGAVRCPLFIAHGSSDGVVPYFMGERLYQLANEPKHFCRLEGNAHNEPLPDEFYTALADFLRRYPPRSSGGDGP